MTHPTSVQIHSGVQLVANLVRVNGHAWMVQVGVGNLFEGHQDIDECDDRIMLGEASHPEEAIEQAAEELEEMAKALRLHGVNLNKRTETYEAKVKELRAKKTDKAKAELKKLSAETSGNRLLYVHGVEGDELIPYQTADEELENEDRDIGGDE